MTQILLIDFLSRIDDVENLDAETYPWELLIRQARHANLLSRVAYILKETTLFNTIPSKPKEHFDNAIKIAAANKRASLWEITDTAKILGRSKIDFILLKGCAYLWLDLDTSRGRLFADTDILVRKKELIDAERALVKNGWVTTKIDYYDQRYYREWTHEIPPLHHTGRHTTLDVHHDIVPPIIQTRFDIDALWAKARQDPRYANLYCPQAIDMILHSATHLFHEGEFDNGLRDLVDLDSLLKHNMANSDDWQSLLTRAGELDLILYLYYALNFTHRILKTPVPEEVLKQSLNAANISAFMKPVMDSLFINALIPDHSSCTPVASKIARQLLFIRSHWLKMPWYLLVPHLFRKSFKR
jgi:hypothetical protein